MGNKIRRLCKSKFYSCRRPETTDNSGRRRYGEIVLYGHLVYVVNARSGWISRARVFGGGRGLDVTFHILFVAWGWSFICELIFLSFLFLLPDFASLSYKISIARRLSSGKGLLPFVKRRHLEG